MTTPAAPAKARCISSGTAATGGESIVASDVTSIDEDFSGISLENDDGFGAGVAIDGGSLAVGVPYRDTGGTNKGAVYLFDPKFETALLGGDFEQDSTPTAGDSKLAEGTITFTVTATDVAGTTGTGTGTFIYDPTVPTVSAARYPGAPSVVDIVVSESVYGSVDADNFSIAGAGNPTVSSVIGLESSKDDADAVFYLFSESGAYCRQRVPLVSTGYGYHEAD